MHNSQKPTNLATYLNGVNLSVVHPSKFLCLLHRQNFAPYGRLVPIMLLKLPIMLWSNAPEFYPLCSNYAPIMLHKPTLCSINSIFILS